LKFTLLALVGLLFSSSALADGYTYRVTLPDHRTELIHSDESGSAHLNEIHDYSYVSAVGHLSVADWKLLQTNKQLPKFDLLKCDPQSCWYGTRNTVNLGDEVDVATSGSDNFKIAQISVVHSYVDSTALVGEPGQLIPMDTPKVITFSTRTASASVLNQPITVTTPLGDIVITMVTEDAPVTIDPAPANPAASH
jgi:hypothetical protein